MTDSIQSTFKKYETGTAERHVKAPGSRFRFLAWLALAALPLTGCSLFVTRPSQEMSDTASAIRSAREVQADTLSPELFRQATEWFFRAKREYRFKNFDNAHEYSEKARKLAEAAEFEALRSGGVREQGGPDPLSEEGVGPPPPRPDNRKREPVKPQS